MRRGDRLTGSFGETIEFEQLDWVKRLRSGLAESDQMIRGAELTEGWALVHHRGGLIREAMRCFYQRVVDRSPPRGAFAIHALGGTGRQEICPGSDIDIGILVENIEENEHFLSHVSRELRCFAPHVPGLGSVVKANAFPDLRDGKHFDRQSLVSLLDSDLLVGDLAFDNRIRGVCQRRAAELGLEFIFAINEDLRRFDRFYPQRPGDIGGFHVKNGIGGLRNFQMTMWLYSFERWISSIQVYEQVRNTRRFDSEGAPTPKVLDAVGVIFCVRCWIEQRRSDQLLADDSKVRSENRLPDLLVDVADMDAFLDRFGAEGLTRLNTARETIRSYRHETLDRLLEQGVVVPETEGLVVWGANGLRVGADALFKDATDLFYLIYGAQQRLNLPIDNSVRRAASKNIADSFRHDAALINLLIHPGPVLTAIKDWFDFGVMDQVVPKFSELANRLYEPGHRAAALTRAARAIQRIQNLEHLDTQKPSEVGQCEAYFVRQYRDLGDSARGALRMALLTDEIPETLYGTKQQYAESVHRYVDEHLAYVPGFSGPTLGTVRFLLLMKRELLKYSEMSDQQAVLEILRQKIRESGSRDAADTIRALALFAYAAFDFHNPQGVERIRLNAEQWLNVQNLTQNLLYQEIGVAGAPFEGHYFDATGQRIGALLPRRLLASPHVDNSLKPTYEGAESLDPQRAHRIIHSLKEVVQTNCPIVKLNRDEKFFRLTLYAWDFPGLFWRVAGTLYESGCSIRSTDLYDIPAPEMEDPGSGERNRNGERRLICDVLTFDAPEHADEQWEDDLICRIIHRLEKPDEQIPDQTAAILQPVVDELCPRLTDLGNGQVKFSCYTPSTNTGTRYAISRILSERAGANIESIARDGTRDWRVPRTNFYIRIDSDLNQVAESLRGVLGEIQVEIDALT
jgi:hypothetical protein